MIKGIAVLAKRELASYFNSPIAYIVVIFFTSFCSIWFFYVQAFLTQNVASMRAYFNIIPIVFIFIIPAITMRSWAEERKLGTAELLLTLPYQEGVAVLGKFFGAIGLILIMMALTIPVPLSIAALGNFEIGEIVGQYLGMFFLAVAATAIGQFISSLSRNQISAFIFSGVILLVLMLIGQINFALNPPRAIAALIRWISFNQHFQSFEIGLVDTRDVAYYLILAIFFLYLNTKILILRKWS